MHESYEREKQKVTVDSFSSNRQIDFYVNILKLHEENVHFPTSGVSTKLTRTDFYLQRVDVVHTKCTFSLKFLCTKFNVFPSHFQLNQVFSQKLLH
jgi:hypothetical protein